MIGDVSVVIPCYNHAHYLPDCLNSIFRQTVQPAEVLVVDDGSTDNTATVAASYEKVRHIFQKNCGLGNTRNNGLAQAKFQYVLFQDADDILHPGALENHLKCFSENRDAAFVVGSYERIDELGQPKENWAVPAPSRADLYCALLTENFISMPGTVLYRRKVLESTGGFDPSVPGCEDYDLYLRLASSHSIAFHNNVAGYYRSVSGSMSSNGIQMFEMSLKALDRQKRNIEKNNDYLQAFEFGKKNLEFRYGKKILVNALTALVSLNFKLFAKNIGYLHALSLIHI